MARFVVATDKFKGNLSAYQVADTVRNGILKAAMDKYGSISSVSSEISLCPMADGGEGSLQTMERVLKESGRDYSVRYMETLNHLGEPLHAPLLLFDGGGSAFIEMAAVCGLNLVPPERRNILRSTTYGLGDMMRRAIEEMGVRKIMLAIGGSGTNDGGFGMLAALGYTFHNSAPFDNRDTATFISNIDSFSDRAVASVTPHLRETSIRVASDVVNPLLGINGATMVYGGQKGAGDHEKEILERAMRNWASVITGGDLSKADFPGAGAAGGVGFALGTLLGASLVPGAQLFSQMLHLEEEIAACELVITGEGRFDSQSLSGKLPSEVCRLAKRYDKPLMLVTGLSEFSGSDLSGYGFDFLIELSKLARTPKDAFSKARELIVSNVAKTLIHNKLI